MPRWKACGIYVRYVLGLDLGLGGWGLGKMDKGGGKGVEGRGNMIDQETRDGSRDKQGRYTYIYVSILVDRTAEEFIVYFHLFNLPCTPPTPFYPDTLIPSPPFSSF